MDSSADSSIDDLVASRTVTDYDTFRYVLVGFLRLQIMMLTPASGGQYRHGSRLFDSHRIRAN